MTRTDPRMLVAAVSLALACSVHAAQSAAGAPTATPSPSQATEPAGAVEASAVNPFVGAPVSLETLKQQIDIAKAKTVLMQEQVAQKSAEIDLQQLPAKRKNELKRALSSGNGGGFPALPAVSLEEGGGSAAKAKAAARAKKEAEAAAAAAAAATPQVPTLQLLGVAESKGSESATLALNGNVAVVQNGDMTPMGRVEIGAGGVKVGGQNLAMHTATLARQALPAETAPATAGRPGGVPAARAGIGALPPPNGASAGNLLPPGLRLN